MDGETKVCIKCGKDKPLEYFQRKRVDSEERRARCRMCRRRECARVPTGRGSLYNGLEGVTLEERAQIHKNYLEERAKKIAYEDALRARMQESWDQESSDWVRHALGFGMVEVYRCRSEKSCSILVASESCGFIDDSFEIMGG